jgi:hypothetical protein
VKIFCADMAIFDHPESDSYDQLRRLFLRAAQGQHEIVLGDVDGLLESDFFEQAVAPMDRREWQELIRNTAFAPDAIDPTVDPVAPPERLHAHLGRDRVPANPPCIFSLTPKDTGEWAEQPLRILLENDRDWRLLEAAARALERSVVENAYLSRWLVVDGRGGGGEVLNKVRARGLNERLFAFVDSDKTGPQAKISATAKKIAEECSEKPLVPFRFTEKREVENYLPRKVLESAIKPKRLRKKRQSTGKTHLEAFSEWVKLSSQARDFDDLKARFGKDLTEDALESMRDSTRCTPEDLVALAGEELRKILDLIEEHL